MKQILQLALNTNIQDKSLNQALLFFRVSVALSMINTHGMKKILHFQETVAHIPDPFGMGGTVSTIIAILANIVCTIFVALGFLTRLNALFILGVTLSGLFLVHFSDPWPVKDVPLMYSLAFILIAWLGPGKFALDDYLFNRK